jgi:acetyl-CoA carboxylase biotin carboxyl carrier protein
MEWIVDLKDIKAIVDLMRKNSISEFELERQDFKIRLKRGSNGGVAVTPVDDAPLVAASASPFQIPTVGSTLMNPVVPVSNELEIKAPMVGTFYRAPSPESAPYVEVGSELNPDTIVSIIEAMKVMNEIKSEVRGVITQILVENGKPVEFGQPLFKYRPV